MPKVQIHHLLFTRLNPKIISVHTIAERANCSTTTRVDLGSPHGGTREREIAQGIYGLYIE